MGVFCSVHCCAILSSIWDLPALEPHVLGWRSSFMLSSATEGHITYMFIALIFPEPWWEVFSSALCLATCTAWTGMIPSIWHSLLLIHVRLANVASKRLLTEGMSTSQGRSIFSVILACTVDRLYDIYTHDCPTTMLSHLHIYIYMQFVLTC